MGVSERRGRAANVFNPAALAIVATFYVFSTGQSWWGALPEVAPFAWIGAACHLLAGVLVGNVWEAWRRANRPPGHRFRKGPGLFRYSYRSASTGSSRAARCAGQ